MDRPVKDPKNRYVNDLRRLDYIREQALTSRDVIIPVGISLLFLAFVAIFVGTNTSTEGSLIFDLCGDDRWLYGDQHRGQ